MSGGEQLSVTTERTDTDERTGYLLSSFPVHNEDSRDRFVRIRMRYMALRLSLSLSVVTNTSVHRCHISIKELKVFGVHNMKAKSC